MTLSEKVNKSLLFVTGSVINATGDALQKSNFYMAHR